MNRAASIHARIDPTLKHDAEKILHQLGLNTSQAINAFYAQIVHVRGIPFELKLPNEETKAAMKELDSGKVEKYNSMQDLWKEIDNG
ncbi:MAG: type II toxin-antitoxin system RelB/DinJ family antitoxin [Tatlockia sp.]|nr:type II toxin-antitoxin system RelB/DinJ family antitoxin [Tatlockia sp.]